MEWMGIILIELNFIHQVSIMNHRREEEIPYFIFWIWIKTDISNVRHLETYTQKHRLKEKMTRRKKDKKTKGKEGKKRTRGKTNRLNTLDRF